MGGDGGTTGDGADIVMTGGNGGNTSGDGGNIQLIAGTVTSGADGVILLDGRYQGFQGTDVTSASDIVLTRGNYFDITGTTTINTISGTGWRAGSVVSLQFDSALTVANLTAGAGAQIRLNGATNFNATAGSTLTLVYSGALWIELARMTV